MPVSRTEAWAIDAIARDAIHDEPGALRAIERALDLAEPRGYASAIVRYGAPVRSLLRRRIAQGTAHRAFAGDLLSALEEKPSARRGRTAIRCSSRSRSGSSPCCASCRR